MTPPSFELSHDVLPADLEKDEGENTFGVVSSDLSLNLVFVMLITSVSMVTDARTELGSVDLYSARPAAKTFTSSDRQPIVITINAKGDVQIGDRRLNAASLERASIDEELEVVMPGDSARELSVLIAPDLDAPWRSVAAVDLAVSALTNNYHTVYQQTTRE